MAEEAGTSTQEAALTLLLINEQAEEVKQTTINMRKHYPGCRVEAVYSVEEALEWAAKQEWRIIVLDDHLTAKGGIDIVPALRQRAPHSAIIVQSERHSLRTAEQVMRAGADFCLSKKSPVFPAELPAIARELVEKHDLQRELTSLRERHACFVDALPELVCELDAGGRFLAVGLGVDALLGYAPHELIGRHYAKLIHPDDQAAGRILFRERRTGLRASRGTLIRLLGKQGGIVRVTCETVGIYGARRQFLGTVATVRSTVSERFPGHAEMRTQMGRAGRGIAPAPAPLAPIISEPDFHYPERRHASRLSVHLTTTLGLHATQYPAIVKSISYSGLYLIVEGAPLVSQGQAVRLNFSLDGMVLDVRGRIKEIRYPPEPTGLRIGQALGVVITYSDLDTIEGPVLASLLDELKTHPTVAQLTVSVTRSGQSG
jgi:PAS domain S-box-containing protein